MEIARHWRLRKQRYSLVGEVCLDCDAKIFPPRDICPKCGKDMFRERRREEWKKLGFEPQAGTEAGLMPGRRFL